MKSRFSMAGLTGGTVFAAAVLAAAPALAHTGVGQTSGFAAGIAHPAGGLDHVLAMAAIGGWAATWRGGRGFVVPLAFVAAMVSGSVAAAFGGAMPGVEGLIALSVIASGLLLATRADLPLGVSAGLVGVFGLLHGHAHGLEATGAFAPYATGFALASLALIGMGAFAVHVLVRFRAAVPVAGTLVAAAGVLLAGF